LAVNEADVTVTSQQLKIVNPSGVTDGAHLNVGGGITVGNGATINGSANFTGLVNASAGLEASSLTTTSTAFIGGKLSVGNSKGAEISGTL
jgi:hypothetical protein